MMYTIYVYNKHLVHLRAPRNHGVQCSLLAPGLRVCAPLVSTDNGIGCFSGGAFVTGRLSCVSSARVIVEELL
jgi:hypothetical protein